MQDRLLTKTLLCASVFFIISMGVMAYANKYKIIYVEEMDISHQAQIDEDNIQKTLDLVQVTNDNYQLKLELPDNIQSQCIQIQNLYTMKEVWIYIQCKESSFYENKSIIADLEKVEGGVFETVEDGVLFRFTMDSVYEYTSMIEGNSLLLVFNMPEDIYHNRIVVDMGSFDTLRGYENEYCTEEQIMEAILNSIKRNNTLENANIYYCGLEGEGITGMELSKEVNADIFIGLQAGWEPEGEKYGLNIYYNEQYYLPQLDCGYLAYTLASSVATEISDRVNYIYGDSSRYVVLNKMTVPSFIIEVGYLSNEKESELLQQKIYQDKIAIGIINAISEMIKIKEGVGTNE